jgi:hypothetical protein
LAVTVVVAVSQGIEEKGRLREGLRVSRDERRSVPESKSDFQPYCQRE